MMRVNMVLCRSLVAVLILACFGYFDLEAQNRPEASIRRPATNALWMGNYLNFRINDKFFWAGEVHYRRVGNDNVPFVGNMANIYNRHGIKYIANPNLSITAGGVLRLDFAQEPPSDEIKRVIVEPRIWHEYLFAMPFPKFMVYHRIRVEHRWSRSNFVGDNYIFRNRWRYKFLMKIPLNNPKLIPRTFYFSPDIEIIMQSGKPVIDSPLEDLRIYPMIGYIASSKMAYSVGMAYTTGQTLARGFEYRERWLLRFNLYLSLDFRKFIQKIPEIKVSD